MTIGDALLAFAIVVSVAGFGAFGAMFWYVAREDRRLTGRLNYPRGRR